MSYKPIRDNGGLKSYTNAFIMVKKLLTDFKEKGVIDVSKLGLIDSITKSAEIDQTEVLNASRLYLNEQRILFGGVRNMRSVAIALKEGLKTAAEKHENPTTAELALEIMPHLLNLAEYIDDFKNRGEKEIAKVGKFSRELHRKAKSLGFYRDIKTQLDEAGITREEIREFMGELKENLELEIDEIEEA